MSNSPKLIVLSALLLASGCVSLVREQPPALTCGGPIVESTSRADLVATFGAEHLRDEEIELGEGETAEGTVIYPDDPSRRVEVVWASPTRRNRVASVRLSEPSDWSLEGLTTGMSLREVERINGRPFSLYGFEWDYSGTTASWNGGKLDSSGACRLLARFRPADDSGSGHDLAGEETFASGDPRMQELNPTIYELLLMFD